MEEGTISKDDRTTVHLKRKVGLPTSLALVMGSIVGSGIFITPGGIVSEVGSVGASLLIWFVCGAISILLSFAYAELATTVPRQGGDFSYLLVGYKPFHKFFGPLPSFLFVWMKLFSSPATVAIAALSFANYVTVPFFPDCKTPEGVIHVVATICILTVTFINLSSVTLASRVIVVLTTLKLLTVGLIVVLGIYRITQGNTIHLRGGFEGSASSPSSYALACYTGLWAYEGWDNICLIVEELINPRRNIPLSVVIGIGLVTVTYVLVNCSYFTVMSPMAMRESGAVAMTWAEHVIGQAAFVIPILVACSVFGMLTSFGLADPRILFAAGREGYLMSIMSMVHIQRAIPAPSLLLQALLGIIYMCLSDIYALIKYRVFGEILFRTMTMVSLLIMRKRASNTSPALFKTPIVILVFNVLFCLFLLVTPIIQDPSIEVLYSFLAIIVGTIFYIPFVYYKLRIPYIDSITRRIQILLLVAPTTDGH